MKRLLHLLLGMLGMVLLCGPAGQAQDLATIAKQRPVTLTGTLDLRTIFYNYSGALVPRRRPDAYVFTGNPTLNVYGVQIPLDFVVSDQQRSIRQPFNQFGLSPTYKWLTIHAGYRNLTWSPFTLAGHTILGAGFEVNSKKIHLGYIKGRFNRATGIDQSLGTAVPFSFDRSGFALKIGAGNDTTYFDASLVVARDDSGSISRSDRKAAGFSGALIRPAENAVFGFNTRQGLGTRRYWYLTAAGGVSIYTREPNSRLKLDNSDASQYIDAFIGPFIAVNGSTEASTAWQAALAYQRHGQSCQISYRRVSPGFQSMGAYYFQDDVANLTIAPSLSLFKSRLRLAGSFGIQNDNLRKQKQLTSKRIIGSANASVELGPYLGVDVGYSNFTTDQQQAKAVAVADSFRLAQSTQSFSVGPRFVYMGPTLGHTVLLSADRSTLRALGNNPYDRRDEFTALNAFASYQLTLLKARLTLGATYSYTQLSLTTGHDENRGLQLTADQTIGKKQALRLGLRGSSLSASRFGLPSTVRGAGARATLRLGRHNSLRTDVAYTSYDPTVATAAAGRYSETRGELGYGFTF